MAVYDINGYVIEGTYDATVKSVNHRGYSSIAPENTLPAYILSKKMGFNYVETDVSFTKDGIPVLLHNATINACARNMDGSVISSEDIPLSSLTFNEVRQYDFGIWKNRTYAGTLIPSLEEFIWLCKSIILHPYIELKPNDNYTQSQIEQIVDIVKKYGMRGKVTYISFTSDYLQYVKNADPEARLGFLSNGYSSGTADIPICTALKTTTNEVFYDVHRGRINQTMINNFSNADIPIEAWTINSVNEILNLNKYVSGITSDNKIAGKVLYDNYMSNNGG